MFGSPSVEESRERARVTEHGIINTAHTKYPGNYHGYSDEWNLDEFEKDFKVEIIDYQKGKELEIDLIGLSSAIANAYRRIMIAEVPTVAIEHCFIYNNTSVIQDEMLAHRFGMIPIRVDPTKFQWKDSKLGPENVSPLTTVVFTLNAKCEKNPNCDPDKTGRRDDLYTNYKVLSGDLKWEPLRDQETIGIEKVEPVQKKILIAKLSNKQQISVKLHAIKGIGRDHTKFSPVATASYRLMPDIKIKKKVSGEAAKRLQDSFSRGVIELTGRERTAKVVNPRDDTGSRNVFRHSDLKDIVKYDLIKDHFIFKVESTGCLPALDILLQSCDILDYKCNYFLEELQSSRFGVDESASVIESI